MQDIITITGSFFIIFGCALLSVLHAMEGEWFSAIFCFAMPVMVMGNLFYKLVWEE